MNDLVSTIDIRPHFWRFYKLKQKKKQKKTPKKLPDFSLEDILNAPKPKAAIKRTDGLGCLNCGSLKRYFKCAQA